MEGFNINISNILITLAAIVTIYGIIKFIKKVIE